MDDREVLAVPVFTSGAPQAPSVQRIEARPAIQLVLDDLEPVDLSFDLPVAPRLAQRVRRPRRGPVAKVARVLASASCKPAVEGRRLPPSPSGGSGDARETRTARHPAECRVCRQARPCARLEIGICPGLEWPLDTPRAAHAAAGESAAEPRSSLAYPLLVAGERANDASGGMWP